MAALAGVPQSASYSENKISMANHIQSENQSSVAKHHGNHHNNGNHVSISDVKVVSNLQRIQFSVTCLPSTSVKQISVRMVKPWIEASIANWHNNALTLYIACCTITDAKSTVVLICRASADVRYALDEACTSISDNHSISL